MLTSSNFLTYKNILTADNRRELTFEHIKQLLIIQCYKVKYEFYFYFHFLLCGLIFCKFNTKNIIDKELNEDNEILFL